MTVASWRHALRVQRWVRTRHAAKQWAFWRHVLVLWAQVAKRGRRLNRSLCARCFYGWHSTAQKAAAVRDQRVARGLSWEAIRRWRQLTKDASHSRHLSRFFGRMYQQRLLQKTVSLWVSETACQHRERCISQDVQDHWREAGLRHAIATMHERSKRRRQVRLAGSRILARTSCRLARSTLETFRQLTLSKCHVNVPFLGVLERAATSWDIRRLLPKAFKAFCKLRAQCLPRSLRVAQRHRHLKAAAFALSAWRAAALLVRRAAAAAEQTRARQCRRAARQWHSWARGGRQRVMREALVLDVEARPPAYQARGRFINQWARWAARRRIRASRELMFAKRCKLNVSAWAFALWDGLIRAALRDECGRLSERIELAAEAEAEHEIQQDAEAEARRQGELARQELSEQLRLKAAEAAVLRSRVAETWVQSANLLGSLEEAWEAAEVITREFRRLRIGSGLGGGLVQDDASVPLQAMERQLVEALDVEGSLRFAVRRGEAEAKKAMQSRGAAEARAANLTGLLEESRRAYAEAMDGLDRKAAALALEGREAQQVVQRLDKVLAGMTFRTRRCDVELQRWHSYS